MNSFADLRKALRSDCLDCPVTETTTRESATGEEKKDLVVLFDKPGSSYSIADLAKVRQRPFASRWYITALNIDWNSVWLRTHFTDNAEMKSPTRRIRDLVKSTITSKFNPVAAKTIMADVLTAWFEMDQSDYYSIATMLASVLSNHGEGVTFETLSLNTAPTEQNPPIADSPPQIPHRTSPQRKRSRVEDMKSKKRAQQFLIRSPMEQNLTRRRFARLLHILFTKISVEAFLVKNNNANIYRLAYCQLETSSDRDTFNQATFWSNIVVYVGALTTFLIQGMFTGYIVIANVERGIVVNRDAMIALAVLTLFLTALLSLPEMKYFFTDAIRFYNVSGSRFSLLAFMDFASNVLIPIVLAASGFLIILSEESFIEAVINSTALLFILEIDDLLPRVFQLDPISIVRNFLISAAVHELDAEVERVKDGILNAETNGEVAEDNTKLRVDAAEKWLQENCRVPKIDFADMFLTNSEESGTNIKESGTFAPYEIQARRGKRNEPDVSNSNFITSDCLLHRIEWRYTYGYGLAREPRIGQLRVWKLEEKGQEKDPYIVVNYNQDDELHVIRPYLSNTEVRVDPHCVTNDPHEQSMADLADRYPDDLEEDDKEEVLNELDKVNLSWHYVEGVYMITVFEVSETLLKLRICGSKTAHDFDAAMHTYSLWDLDASAISLLRKNKSRRVQERESGEINVSSDSFEDEEQASLPIV